MFIFLMLFAFGYSFFAQCMDFNENVMWLRLVEHDGVEPHVYPKPPVTYYFEKIYCPGKCEKSEVVITQIKGNGSAFQHIISDKKDDFRINSQKEGIKLLTLNRDANLIIVFLNTENKIIGAISNMHLKMFFCCPRYSSFGSVPVNDQAIDNIISLHTLTTYPELFEDASAAVNLIFEKYKDICLKGLEYADGRTNINISWIETEYKSILTQETKEIKGALVPFIMNMQAEETKKNVIAVQAIQRQQKISNENKRLKNFTYSLGVGSLLAIMLCVLCYYKLS